jgi:Mor family transcriptional regulator
MQVYRRIERSKNGERNREIFSAIKGGESVESVAVMYGLKPTSVSEIIRTEKHLREVCPDPVYRALRGEDA